MLGWASQKRGHQKNTEGRMEARWKAGVEKGSGQRVQGSLGGGGESACPVKQGESGVARTRLVVRNKAGEFNGAHPHRDLYEFPQGTYF